MRTFYLLRAVVCFLLAVFIFNNGYGQTLSGTYTIPGMVAGTQVNNLTDLANLLDAPATVNGTVIFQFTSSYTSSGETFPIFFIPFSGTGNVVIRPAASVVTPLITTGSPSGSVLVDFHGVDNLTIDGRPGGTGTNLEWEFQDTNSGTEYATFQFLNGAVHDTLQYITILASGTNTIGTVTFGTSTVAGGNSNNVIEYCNIGNYSAFPYNQILCSGTSANPNSGNKILNNNIYNFQGYYSTSYNAGISITSTGSGSNWVISGNSLYATSIASFYGMSCIYFSPGSTSTGNVISGNYIGGQAPLCAGGRMDFRGDNGYTYPDFNGIYLNAGGNTLISDNTIQNILCDSRYLSQMVCGINIVSGSANVLDNVVGSATDTNDIHQGGLGVVVGIWDQSPDTVSINGNTVANLTVDAAYPPTSWTYGDMIGIYAYSGSNTVGPSTIINNKVFNLSTSNTDNYNQYYPINSGGGTSTYEIGSYSQCLLAGIYLQTTSSSNQVISENQVYNLEINAVGVSYSDYIFGITSYAGTGTNTVNGNLVYNIWTPDVFGNTNYFVGITGIYLPASSLGKYSVTNNMVALGLKPNGTTVQNALISGIWDNTQSNNTNLKLHIYHNSIYIAGTDLNSKSNNLNSFCLRRDLDYGSSVYDSLDIKNNIFFNARTTTSTIAYNYDIYLNSVIDVSCNYNDLFGSSSSSYELGWSGTTNCPTLVNWKTVTTFDANSINKQPQFISDSTSTPNLHVQATSPIDMAGTATATIVYDIDSFVRANYTPVDIGAAVIDACGSNTITPSVTLSPSQNDVCKGTSIVFTATPTNGGSGPTYNFYLDGVSVQNGTSATYTSGSLNNNDSVRVVMTSDSTCLSTPTGTSADVVLIIKAIVTSTVKDTLCQGANYDGHTATGTYVDTFTAVNGCDSIRTLDLVVNAIKRDTVNQTICQGVTYGGHGATGVYIDTFTSSNNCDSIRTLNLTVNPVKRDTVNQTICQGTTYDGHSATGVYIDTFTAVNSCDSIRTLNLTVNPIKRDTVNQTICQGTSYGGHSATGVYIDTFTAANSCDSIRTLDLTVNPLIRTTISQSICQGQSYLGHSASGTYIDTFTATNSCDSIRTLDLTVNPLATTTVTQSICQGQNYDGHITTGTYVDTFTAENGCDSVRTLHLTVQSTITDSIIQSICAGNNYDGHSANGTYIDTFKSAGGCDSVRTLFLTVLPVSTSAVTQAICQGQSYDGHSAGGTYTDTLRAVNGCDSIVTLTLTILPVTTTNITANICPGQSYDGHSTTGTYVDTLKAFNGCDSIRTLHLNILSISSTSIIKTICQGQSYDGHSNSGIYTDTLQSGNGCDSIVTLNLTVLGNITDTVAKSICAGNNYDGHNQTGTFIDTFQSVEGCDSIRTLFLTVNPVLNTNLSQTICQGERYGGHTTSGIYTDTLQSQYGCDSIRTVILTVNPISTTTINAHICQGQSYNGHTNSGNYVDTLGAYDGCDSIIYLTLSVQTQITTTVDDSICAGSNYFGYSHSGSYVDTFIAAGGCDSIRTLNLLVFPLITNTVTTTICSGSNYDGHDSTGTYIDTLQATNGCDSIRTLHLSILPIAIGINKVQICQGDSFEGHTTQGSYIDTLTAFNGCDSIVTLEITVNPAPAIPVIYQDGNTLTCSSATGYQWYQSGNKLVGDTSQQLVLTQNGDYSVAVKDSNGCSSTSSIDTVLSVGIAQIGNERLWKIFPNPSSGQINIELKGIEASAQITLRIFDATGKMEMDQAWMPSGNNYSQQVNLDNFAEGLYLIQVRQGDWSISQRIVISR